MKSEDDAENRETGDSPILKEEEGVDNIPADILKYGGPGIIDILTVVCQKIWTSGLEKVTDYSCSEERQHTIWSGLRNNQPDSSP